MPRYILHVDVDQFIAAVELLRRPELRGRPVVVGGSGDPTRRGVVATASYEARKFGIDSGMPLRTAARRCPEAVFLPVDPPAYRAASEQVMAALGTFRGVLEVAGWDEAYLEVEAADPESLARDIRRAVSDRTGLSCSVGIGRNKLQAKIASGLAKPGGVFRLTSENWTEVMDGLPPHTLWGIGRKRGRQLEALGIRTVADLAAAEEGRLAEAFGPAVGPWLRRVARGEDDTPVLAEPHPAKSRGREETYQEDIADPQLVREEVVRLAREVVADLGEEGRPAVRIIVKVRFAPFDTHTHSVPVRPPGRDEGLIERAALEALDRFELDRPVRLLGVRADLAPPEGTGTSTRSGQ